MAQLDLALRSSAPPQPRDPVLTARLVLTPISAGDVDQLTVLHTDPLVAHWTGPWDSRLTADWTADMAERWSRDGVGKWLVRDRLSTELIGRGGFTRTAIAGEDVLELGWSVRDALTGRGYATEIGRAALAWAATFHPALPVVAFTEVHNAASRAVMHRIGLRPGGILHREGLVEGRPGLHPDAPFALYRLGPATADDGRTP
jgi:RimJ/RimL family protein N-acetyltransferase